MPAAISKEYRAAVSGGGVLLCAAAALTSGAELLSRPLGARAADATSKMNFVQAIGSVETKKFLGDWASMSPSSHEDTVERELIKVTLDTGLQQLRGIYCAGAERYGEEYELNEGSTDNAYLLAPTGTPDKPTVLIGVHDERFAEEFVEALGADTIAGLSSLILQYFDGKQAGTVEALLRARPESAEPLQIYGSQLIVTALKKKLPEDLLGRVSFEGVRNKTLLEMEDGRSIRFLLTPTPKTPEACVAFDPETGTLFSGKFFSAHKEVSSSCSGFDGAGNAGWEELSSEWFHLFDNYFFTQNAQAAIRKLFMLAEALHGPDVQQLAPMHGPVVREQCWKLMAKYEAWTEQKLRQEGMRDVSVLVMYASAYGHTKTMANAVADGLKSASVNVNMMNLEHCSAKDVNNALQACNGFFLGSPTLGGEMPTQVKEALGVVLSAASSEDTERVPCGVFGSYGWSGEAVDEMHFRLKDGGFPFVCDPIRVRFRPTAENLDVCKEAGVRMSQKLQSMSIQKQQSRARKIEEVAANTATEAFGKMRSSFCAIATKNAKGEDYVTPISWVNQASFDPPGVTMAIPKQDLDPFLNTDLDEQLVSLFKRYDKDGGGSLDREETAALLKELFGAGDDEARAKFLESKTDEALDILDENKDGEVSLDEIRSASQSGPLSEMLNKQRKLLALEAALGAREDGGGLEFVLNVLPEDAGEGIARDPVPHPKAKPANGCMVLKDSNAYIECTVSKALNAGDSTILYAKVTGGKVLKANDLTQLVSAQATTSEPAMA